MDTEDSTLQFYNTHIRPLTKQQISRQRLQLFNLLNGDVFYPIRIWRKDIENFLEKTYWRQ